MNGGLKMIYWCNNCSIPFHVSEKKTCPNCNGKGFFVSNGSLVPVFKQEKRILSHIINKDISDKNVWFKGNAYYLIDGKTLQIPYVDYYKSKRYLELDIDIGEKVDLDDSIINEELFLNANEIYLQKLIYEAEEYIKKTVAVYSENSLPIVSFSGGKDSTVVSRLVMESLQKKDIIHFFGDTTLEFPTTYEYCNNSFKKNNTHTPLLDTKSEKDFFKLCDYLGPPSRFERWCCTIFKTSNISKLMETLPPDTKSISFMGIRRHESNKRKNYKRTREDSKISNQIVSMPIIEWTDFDVWLYIRYKKLIFNDAYKMGYRRVGCWCCPNNSHWSELLTAIYYPNLSQKWRQKLLDFAEVTEKFDVEDYICNDRWKMRKGASGLKSKNIDIKDTDCFEDTNVRNYILDKNLHEGFIEFLKPFGKLTIFFSNEKYIISTKGYNKKLSFEFKKDSKILKVKNHERYNNNLLNARIKCQIRKYQFCINCTACDAVCPKGAITTLKGQYRINEDKCTNCMMCVSYFYNGCLISEVLSSKKGG